LNNPGHYILLFFALSVFSFCNTLTVEVPDHPEYFDKIFSEANNLIIEDKPDQAARFVDSIYRHFPEPGTADIWRKFQFMSHYYNVRKNQPAKALTYVDSMELVLKGAEIRYPRLYAESHFSRGDIQIAMDDFQLAFESYFKGRQFVAQYLDTCDFAGFSSRQGSVRYKQGKYKEAISYFKQAQREYTSCRERISFYVDIIIPQSNLNTIALAYEKLGLPDSAINYYYKALEFIDQTEHLYPNESKSIKNARGVIYGNLGGAYMMAGRNQEAENLLLKSIEINGPGGFNDNDALTACIKLSSLYISEGRIEDTGALMATFDSMSKRVSDELRVRWLKQKFSYYDLKNDLKNAYEYSVQYTQLKDSLNERLERIRQVDFNTQAQNLEQRYALEKLQTANEIKNMYLLTASVFLIMTIAILFILLKNSKRSRKLISDLRFLNVKVSEQNKELQISLRLLEESQEENTKMLKIVAHDLRNPIGGIHGLSDILLNETELTFEQKEMIVMIQTASTNSLDLINDLLHTNVRQKDLNKEAVDLYTVINYCTDMLSAAAQLKNQKLELNTQTVVTEVSREKMWRVISNLINNAIKFSPEGGTITIGLKEEGGRALISVIDKGIGIPEQMKDKVFELFTLAKRPGTQGEQSFGLGLAISKQIVEAHDGRIWFESIEGEGTTFYVELPIIQPITDKPFHDKMIA
jgi:signal transduction histidine kinase